MRLDKHQKGVRRAILAKNRAALQVKACAGSGKTRTMVATYVSLVKKHKLHPRRIIVTTFSKQAAGEIRDRIESELGCQLPESAPVGTFHSLCLRWLRADAAHRWDMDNCLDTAGFKSRVPSTFNLMRSIIGWSKIPGTNKKGLDLGADEEPGDYLNAVAILRGQGLRPGSPGAATAAQDAAPGLPALHKVWSLMEEAKVGVGGFDFADMLGEAARRLGQDLAPDTGWPAFVIGDEGQDNNAIQYELMFKLAAPRGKVVIIGDEWQSIYAWRGADPELFIDFAQDHEADVLMMPINYRSGTKIVALSARIRGEKVYARPGAPAGLVERRRIHSDEPGKPPTTAEEGASIAETVQELLQSGRAPSDIAVLLRTNAYAAPVEINLMKREIPVKVVGRSFWKRREAQTYAAYAQLILNPTHNALAFVMNRPKRFLPKALAVDVMREVPAIGLAAALRMTTGRLHYNQLKDKDAFADWVDETMRLPWGLQAEAIGQLLTPSPDMSDDAAGRVEDSLEVLVEMAKECTGPNSFVRAFEAAEENADRRDPDADAVVVTTVHSAKGLEWPVVIVGASANRFPHARAVGQHGLLMKALDSRRGPSDNLRKALLEEQRLFYVACTRAEDHLLVTYGTPSVFVREFL